MILYPAIDILDGKAVRLVQGDFDAGHRLRATTRSRPRRAWVRGRRALPARRRPRRRARRRAARTSTTSSGSPRELACRSSTAAACARCRPSATRCAPGAERVILGTAAFTDVDFLDDVLARATATARRRRRRRARRPRRDGGLDRDDADAAPRPSSSGCSDRGVRSFVYTNVDRDGMLEGPDLDEVKRIARGRARALPVLGRHRLARRPAGAAPSCARSTSAGVIVGKALYEGRFTVAEAQAALDER